MTRFTGTMIFMCSSFHTELNGRVNARHSAVPMLDVYVNVKCLIKLLSSRLADFGNNFFRRITKVVSGHDRQA